jgi:signal transduction histidine kinase
LALGIAAALLIAFIVTAPFARIQLPRVDAFIPAIESTILFNDLVTSALLFSQFSIVRRRELWVLASGFLFTALIVIPHALTFPGAFAPAGLLGAGLQSASWLYTFWKAGLPLAVIVYVLCKDRGTDGGTVRCSPVVAIGWSIAVAIAMVCGLTLLSTTGEWLLPISYLDNVRRTTVTYYLVGGLAVSLVAVALALLLLRRRSVLDLWLMVMCWTLLLELLMTELLANSRFSVGWYASRTFGLIAAILVLLVLLAETTALYANLARSAMMRRGAREARHIAMDAMAASIAHEVNQPLGSIVSNAEAALLWLMKKTPDLDEARAALKDIVAAGQRAAEVISSVRTMFTKNRHGRTPVAVNDLVQDALNMVVADLRSQRVSVSTELHDGLPRLLADRGQLQQVLLNLTMNAIEAMSSVTDRARLLRIKSELVQESSEVLVTIEDSGTGIEGDKDRIFEPFFTTKSTGTGVGLAICRSIIESHGGSILASPNKPYGMIFRVALPIEDL